MAVRSLRLVVTLATVLLCGCTYTASGTSPGSVVISRPLQVPPPPVIAVPVAAVAPAPRQGRYAGTGQLLADPGLRGACRQTIQLDNFVVDGDRVRFGGFRGRIDSAGGVDMLAGHRHLSGQFIGERFEGRFWQPPPACKYRVRLDPTT